MSITRSCPVCEHAITSLVYDNTVASIDGLDMSYMLSQCNHCGFYFADNLPSQIEYFQYYNKLSKYDSQTTITSVDRQRADSAVNILLRKIPKDTRIVDIGCGFGVLLAALQDAGYNNLIGVDPAPNSAKQAFDQFGLQDIYQGTLEDAGVVVDLAKADLICLMCVLEHLPDLRQDIKNLISMLNPGSLIFVEVPAIDLFDGQGGEPYGELSLEHIQYFSIKSMYNFLSGLGLKVLDSELLQMPNLHSGSLFMLAEVGENIQLIETDNQTKMVDYLKNSATRWSEALKHVPDKPFVLYGTGSHSARLLPSLNNKQRNNLVAVFDGNINLHGKYFGDWLVESPEELAKYPDLPILISSYRSEQLIADTLKMRFPDHLLQLMYNDV
jgi:SAM-dependent methyltransferase